jgi:hypothetical protein
VIEVWIVEVHNLHLAPVNSFKPEIDVRNCEEVKPKLSFRLAHVRNSGVSAP